ASATALRYCGTANLACSPSPTTSTREAVTPARSWSRAVRPVLPATSPRPARAVRRPPLAAAMACAAGVSDLSAKIPTTTQSISAEAGADWCRAWLRVMRSCCALLGAGAARGRLWGEMDGRPGRVDAGHERILTGPVGCSLQSTVHRGKEPPGAAAW